MASYNNYHHHHHHSVVLVVCIILGMLISQNHLVHGDGLSYNYYSQSCPNVEQIVKDEVTRMYNIHGNAATSFTRNIFHDCAVQGCDASLLLKSTADKKSELDSDRNFGLRNMKYLDDIKAAVEQACPGVVSCADLLILSGRDGIAMLGGPQFQVRTGRRDTREFSFEAAETQLPAPDVDITTFLNTMTNFNLNTPQAVAILGAHSVGRTHCKFLEPRLYPTVDTTLNSTYADYLKMRCSLPKALRYARNDESSPMTLDNHYFRNIMQLRGNLKLDNNLYLDTRTRPFVEKFAQDTDYFFQQFVEGITILSEHNVLTGTQGEIRKNCNWVN